MNSGIIIPNEMKSYYHVIMKFYEIRMCDYPYLHILTFINHSYPRYTLYINSVFKIFLLVSLSKVNQRSWSFSSRRKSKDHRFRWTNYHRQQRNLESQWKTEHDKIYWGFWFKTLWCYCYSWYISTQFKTWKGQVFSSHDRYV